MGEQEKPRVFRKVDDMKKTTTRWYDLHPTMEEMERRLKAAGVPTSPELWTAEDVLRAAEVLNK